MWKVVVVLHGRFSALIKLNAEGKNQVYIYLSHKQKRELLEY